MIHRCDVYVKEMKSFKLALPVKRSVAFITRQDTCDTDAVLCDRRDPWDCKELINEGLMPK